MPTRTTSDQLRRPPSPAAASAGRGGDPRGRPRPAPPCSRRSPTPCASSCSARSGPTEPREACVCDLTPLVGPLPADGQRTTSRSSSRPACSSARSAARGRGSASCPAASTTSPRSSADPSDPRRALRPPYRPAARDAASPRGHGARAGPVHWIDFEHDPPRDPCPTSCTRRGRRRSRPVEPVVAGLGEFLRERGRGRARLPARRRPRAARLRATAGCRARPHRRPGPLPDARPRRRPVVLRGPGRAAGPQEPVNIFRELETDLGLPTPSTGDLTPWADQGVLLLNRVLTVAPGKPGQPPRPGLGGGHRRGHRGPRRARRPARRHPLGPRRPQGSCRTCPASRASSPAPEPAVGARRVLRVAAVQPGQRPARPQGADPVDWRLP